MKEHPPSEAPCSDLQRRVLDASGDFMCRLVAEIRSRRQERRLTQAELATALQQCGIQASQGYLSLIEAGQRTDPSIRLVIALSIVLDISLDSLLRPQDSESDEIVSEVEASYSSSGDI